MTSGKVTKEKLRNKFIWTASKIICIDRNCKQNACIIYLYLNRFELVGIFLEGKIMHPAHLSILCFVLGTQSFLIQGNVLFEKYYLFNSNNKK